MTTMAVAPAALSLYEFFSQFPDEKSAVAFFENRRWGTSPYCPHCGSVDASAVPSGKPMPFRPAIMRISRSTVACRICC